MLHDQTDAGDVGLKNGPGADDHGHDHTGFYFAFPLSDLIISQKDDKIK